MTDKTENTTANTNCAKIEQIKNEMKLNLNHFTMMSIIILFCSCASTTQFTKFAGTEKLESTS